MLNNTQKAAFEMTPPLCLPAQDRVFSGIYHGAYLTKDGKLYALGATDPNGILGKKDGAALIAKDVADAAISAESIAYVTLDGHLHVHGGPLMRVFAEGPAFTGARAVYTLNLDAFVAIGDHRKKYVFGNNKYNIFGVDGDYAFRLNVRTGDAPEILETMREKKAYFGVHPTTRIFEGVPAYWAWEKEAKQSPEVKKLTSEYQAKIKLVPSPKYNTEDGSPVGMYLYAKVPNAFVIRPESKYTEGVRMAPENTLYMTSPLFPDNEALRMIDPAAHKKAVYIHDEMRWLMLDGTELYLLEGKNNQIKTVLANDIADFDVSNFRVLILTTSGALFQTAWRQRDQQEIGGTMLNGVFFPLASFPAFRARLSGGILARGFNKLLRQWEVIDWRP